MSAGDRRAERASAFILTFTDGMSLREWERTGLLAREWALYQRLLVHYPLLIFVTHGTGDEPAIARRLDPALAVIHNQDRLSPDLYARTVPARVLDLLRAVDSPSAIVKTNQMEGGLLAVAITRHLRDAGIDAALIARGGYAWSRFLDAGDGKAVALEAERRLCRAADLVVGTTREMIAYLAGLHGLDASRTAVIPNYIAADAPARTAADRSPDEVLYAGQLVPRKRIDLLIRAVALAAQRIPIRLRVIGDGPELDRLRALAADVGAAADFLPRMPHAQLLEHMSRCAIYAQASSLEGHPKTVIEAMAAAAPVVIAEAPGMSGLVEHGVSGLMLPADQRRFADAFADLLAQPARRDALGLAAARSARARFALGAILPLELAAHRSALSRRSNGVTQ